MASWAVWKNPPLVFEDADVRPGGADYGEPRIDASDDEFWNFPPQEDES